MSHFINGINQESVFFTKQNRKKNRPQKTLRAALKIYKYKKPYLNIYPDLLDSSFLIQKREDATPKKAHPLSTKIFSYL